MKILKTRNMRKWGYVIKDVEYDGSEFGSDPFILKSAYTPEGLYIGDTKMAVMLCKKLGISPQLNDSNHDVCSIGRSSKNGKWYGWSHRAICGFEIGSTCKRGDCHYNPVDKDDFAIECKHFWEDDEFKVNVEVEHIVDSSGECGVEVTWEYTDKVKNNDLKNTISGIFIPYPKKFGRGEWVAETIDDAMIMAKDFANGVG